MCDKLVFDLSQEIEGSPNVFIRKDWINILDNQNQNYNNNQSVVDTSQLSNSNKYMSYRESYFLMPFLVTIQQTDVKTSTVAPTVIPNWSPNTVNVDGGPGGSADYACGLKNWFGQIIHSFTLDYNGTTICQQTPFINMWNSFKLLTSLSLDDINTQGATIGFYPDDASSWQFIPHTVVPVIGDSSIISGQGVCNNTSTFEPTDTGSAFFNTFNSGKGNDGFLKRQQLINFDIDGAIGKTFKYGDLLNGGHQACVNVWKSYISKKANSVSPNVFGCIQHSIVATIYLKHVHSFFNMCPLLKGVFMKMTLNLNNTTTDFTTIAQTATTDTSFKPIALVCTNVTNALGGVNPLMLASASASLFDPIDPINIAPLNPNGGIGLFPPNTLSCGLTPGSVRFDFKMNISVGSVVLDSSLSVTGRTFSTGELAKSIYLYIPAYTFNTAFEKAYLSSPIKQIKYTDVYQYQVQNIGSGQTFNNLLTNGIANVKSVLILPFYSSSATDKSTVSYGPAGTTLPVDLNHNTGIKSGLPVFQSPFDPAGTGPTSPLGWISNFNVQVSGQNAIYNTQKYNFEQFNNQLYGQNAVNGGCTDGLTSGLIDRTRFDMEYNYYYVNVERMLPVEASVPKSIQILGTSQSAKALDLWCFVEYGSEISIDALTGSRV